VLVLVLVQLDWNVWVSGYTNARSLNVCPS
jgi:hypothetical protein